MSLSFFDSHAHLGDEALYPNIDSILERAKKANLSNILNICTNVETLERGLLLQKSYPWIFNAAATTPHDAEKEGEVVFPLIAHHARQGDLAAIGETGLDYYYYKETQESQKHFLRLYLQLALECELPVVIHCRDAFSDLFQILDEEYIVNGKHATGVLHCFTGTLAEAKEVIARGWYLSLSGIVTFKKSHELKEVAKWVPLNQLLIETDAPYLAPHTKRGSVNEPGYLPETASLIAQAKGLTLEEVAAATSTNCFNFLKKS
ncbi:MAG: TatD family hydrolase [Parachlamydiaceae bacterium]|nr:TatD family hydrolase [Parachlamydiaceae bacterium]